MSQQILLSKNNLNFLIRNLKIVLNNYLKQNTHVKEMDNCIEKSKIIDISSTLPNSLLSDDSTYNGNLSSIIEMKKKIDILYNNIFMITNINGENIINCDKYKYIISIIDNIIIDGDGNTFLDNSGNYIGVVKYIELSDEEKNKLIEDIKGEI